MYIVQWLGMTSYLPCFYRVTNKEIPADLVSTVAVVVEVEVSAAIVYRTQ